MGLSFRVEYAGFSSKKWHKSKQKRLEPLFRPTVPPPEAAPDNAGMTVVFYCEIKLISL